MNECVTTTTMRSSSTTKKNESNEGDDEDNGYDDYDDDDDNNGRSKGRPKRAIMRDKYESTIASTVREKGPSKKNGGIQYFLDTLMKILNRLTTSTRV